MKVCILGQGPRALTTPADYQVWVINGPNMPDRWDRLYQLHSLGHLTGKYGEPFLDWLRTIEPPHRLVMVSGHDEIPGAEAYPWDAVLAAQPGTPYLTHSTPLLIAAALVERAEAIMLDGFSDRPGLEAEKACVEFHLGVAQGRGVQVTVSPSYGLFAGAGTVYGLQEAQWIAERTPAPDWPRCTYRTGGEPAGGPDCGAEARWEHDWRTMYDPIEYWVMAAYYCDRHAELMRGPNCEVTLLAPEDAALAAERQRRAPEVRAETERVYGPITQR